MVSPSGIAVRPLRRQRELARPRAEAELDERLLVGRADNRLAVHALERQAADPAPAHGVRQRLERRPDALVLAVDEHLQALAAALDVEHGLGAGEDDVGAGLARGTAAAAGRPAAGLARGAAPVMGRRTARSPGL